MVEAWGTVRGIYGDLHGAWYGAWYGALHGVCRKACCMALLRGICYGVPGTLPTHGRRIGVTTDSSVLILWISLNTAITLFHRPSRY